MYLHHVRSTKEFSLYFVPVVPYGSNDYLLCPICRHGLQLRPDQNALVDQMLARTTAFRRGAFPGDYRVAAIQFWRQLGFAQLGGQTAVPTPRPSDQEALASPVDALSARLESLGRLHAEGILTEEEFTAAKRRLLDI